MKLNGKERVKLNGKERIKLYVKERVKLNGKERVKLNGRWGWSRKTIGNESGKLRNLKKISD